MSEDRKANFSEEFIATAINVHVMDKDLEKKQARPPFCARRSKPSEDVYDYVNCRERPEPQNCKLCNPKGKI